MWMDILKAYTNNEHRRHGSITVEAVYIVPITLMIIMTIVYVLLIAHDRGVVYLELRRLAENCSRGQETDTDSELLDRRMLLYRCEYVNCSIDNDRVSISAVFSAKNRKLLVFEALNDILDYKVEIRQNVYNHCKRARELVTLFE